MDINEIFDAEIVETDDNGYDVVLKPKDDMKVVVCEKGYDKVTMMVRDVVLPKIGSRRTIGGRLVKVKDIEIDSTGHIFVIADTGDKYPWA